VTATLCKNDVEPRSSVLATAQTGIEMEALVAATAAALTVYDMCKALDKSNEFARIALVSETGGESGDFHRDRGAACTEVRIRVAKNRNTPNVLSGPKSGSSRGAV
jgi:MoaC family